MNREELRKEFDDVITTDMVYIDVEGDKEVIKTKVRHIKYTEWLEQKIIEMEKEITAHRIAHYNYGRRTWTK